VTGRAYAERVRLSKCLEEVTRGVGGTWSRYRMVGATRGGLAPAKEGVGKNPERYKLVEAGTIFYNPMRILLGSIALLDEGQPPGITSPDYVVFRTRSGMVHPCWFYYWLRSEGGEAFIRTLARGAVRERMLFRRLAEAEIEVPAYESQLWFAWAIRLVERARAAAEAQLEAAKALSVARLRAVFDNPQSSLWPRSPLRGVADLLASRSIASDGDTPVQAITTACLTEIGFSAAGVKAARMWRRDVLDCIVSPNEVLVARSNTAELVGRASRFEGEPAGVVASDLTIRIRAKEDLLPGFLSGYLSFLYVTGYWKERSGGASGTMKKITREQLQTELIPVPPRATQKEVDARIMSELTEARQLRLLIESRLATINVLPSALLRRAFSGEL
jgi:hypothetical protein